MTMPREWSFQVQGYFADSRPVLDVKYDIEKRVRQLLSRDGEQPEALVYRGWERSYTTAGATTVELRLEAAYEFTNLYRLWVETTGPEDRMQEKKWEENLGHTLDRWLNGLARTDERAPGSAERYRQIVEQTVERGPDPQDPNEVRAIQAGILEALRRGSSFRTVHHEGGTNIRFQGAVFVFETYGESNDCEEFGTEEAFLTRLRSFYEWDARRDWYPHAPPEIEAWKFIERQMTAPDGRGSDDG